MSHAKIPRHAAVPVFYLYGEPRRVAAPRFLHLEPLAARSRPSEWNIRAHAHSDLNHIFFISRGQGQMAADGRAIGFTAPCLLIIPSGIVHGFAYEPDAAGWVLTIADAYLHEITRRESDFKAIFAAAGVLAVEDEAAMGDRLTRLGQELIWNAPGYAAAIEGHLLGVLVAALRLSHQAAQSTVPVAGRAARLTAKFREAIETSYRSHASVQDYAAMLHITPAQLRRACLQIARQPPIHLVQDRLYLEAQRILLYTNMTVAEAADYLGFADHAYFSRFFARRAGCSPRGFRQGAPHHRDP